MSSKENIGPMTDSQGPAAEVGDAGLRDPKQWVDQYGDALFRYALIRVRDTEAAKDLVQEAFLAAIQARERFSGRSSPKTWLIGILKHKIVDHYRKVARESGNPDRDPEDAAFGPNGRWRTPPTDWKTDPGVALDRKEFWDALRRCLAELPPRQAAAFSLRELEGLDTEEIRQVFEATATNVWVLLHRARMGLRECLAAVGFSTREEKD